MLIPKGTSDVSELEKKVLSLYAKGVSDRDISDVVNEIYGFELSHETISNIVDRVQPRVIEWQNRRLDKVYPSAVRIWNDGFVYVKRLFDYPAEIRKMIYTTNAIESFNSALRKVTNGKAAFPNTMSVMKIMYLRTLDIVAKWTMPYPNWSVIRSKLDILWGFDWDK